MARTPQNLSEFVEDLNEGIKFLEARADALPEGREKQIAVQQLEMSRAYRDQMIAKPEYYTGAPYSWMKGKPPNVSD